MALITASKTKPIYDAVIVGSGAAGGQTAYTLAMAGAKVLMLEAGRNYDPRTETPMFQIYSQAPLRGAGTPDKFASGFGADFYSATIEPSQHDEPYTNASTRSEEKFQWSRVRMLGGRTNHWGRLSIRYGPNDFQARRRDGLGFDWPMTYEDVAPYFDKVEMLIGVYGENDSEFMPHSSPGVLLPQPKLRAGELYVQKHAKKLGIPVTSLHRAVLTRQLDYRNIPAKLHPNNPTAQRILAADMMGRAPCFWATNCNRGCSIRATYSSTTVHIPPALATGNLDILPNAMAREVTLGSKGKATGVTYIDKTTGRECHASGRIVVLCGGSFESVRLLLNSKTNDYPGGLANTSGLVGKYITNNAVTGITCQIPILESLPPHNEDGAGGAHAYIPWWLNAEQEAGKLDFPRPYHILLRTGRTLPSLDTVSGLEWMTRGSYGRQFKEDARRYYGSFVSIAGTSAVIPNKGSFCELDPTVKDKWGIPVLRFHWQWSEYEKRQQMHKRKTIMALIDTLGGRPKGDPVHAFDRALDKGAWGFHELGGAIKGADPRSSVTNQWGQTWDVKNLFLADGSGFCSQSQSPPTETIMALAWRGADYMLDEMQKGNL